MPWKELKIIMKAFISSQFAYCPLIWMFHSRHINLKINKLHERALKIVHNNHFSSFEELLPKNKSVTVHQRNLQTFATEMHKILSQILCKLFLKLKVTTIILVMRQNFPQKQLDMDYRPSLTWFQKFGALCLKRWNKLLL